MRILHTSDWHIGRTFHGESVLAHLEAVLDRMHEQVREHEVDVVIIAGDIFDSTMPSAEALQFFDARLEQFVADGVQVVVTSGNHDSAVRLGYHSRWLGHAGIHIFADPSHPAEFVELADASGPVRIYGIPYLEPAIVRRYAEKTSMSTQRDAIAWAMHGVTESREGFGGRSVVVAHCFAAGVPDSALVTDIERDLTAGGLDVVPTELFAGAHYTALGHIHGRAQLSETIRYSGAPLHYSFSEAGQPRGSWLVELGSEGVTDIDWLELPVPRPLVRLTGTLRELMDDPKLESARESWVSAQLTDPDRPVDAMRRLRLRFPHTVQLEFVGHQQHRGTRPAMSRAATPEEHTDAFLRHVRQDHGLSEIEREVLLEALDELREQEATR